jgi:cytochrome c-type biogenesis protein CcmE
MNRWKIIISCVIIVGASLWLAYQGYLSGKSYYLTVEELLENPSHSAGKALRVGGDVLPGSVDKSDGLRFTLIQGNHSLSVSYVGTEPLPDTFRDQAQAVVDGQYDVDQELFLADKIQAKCASKYETKGPRTVGSFQPPAMSKQ